jgi:hypothetical protein
MLIAPGDESAIRGGEEPDFYAEINALLLAGGYDAATGGEAAKITNDFTASSNIEALKLAHKPHNNAVKAYQYYGQRQFSFLRFGKALLSFDENAVKQPVVVEADGENYIAKSFPNQTSLCEYLKRFTFGVNTISAYDFLLGKKNLMSKLNVKEGKHFVIPFAELCFAYYIAWKKHSFIITDAEKTGEDFIKDILKINIENVFCYNKATALDLYNKTFKKFEDYQETYQFRLEKYLSVINDVFEANPHTHFDLEILFGKIKTQTDFIRRSFISLPQETKSNIPKIIKDIVAIKPLLDAPCEIEAVINSFMDEILNTGTYKQKIIVLNKYISNDIIESELGKKNIYQSHKDAIYELRKYASIELSLETGQHEEDFAPIDILDSGEMDNDVVMFSFNDKEWVYSFFEAEFKGESTFLKALHEYVIEGNGTHFSCQINIYYQKGLSTTGNDLFKIYVDTHAGVANTIVFARRIRKILDQMFNACFENCPASAILFYFKEQFKKDDEFLEYIQALLRGSADTIVKDFLMLFPYRYDAREALETHSKHCSIYGIDPADLTLRKVFEEKLKCIKDSLLNFTYKI